MKNADKKQFKKRKLTVSKNYVIRGNGNTTIVPIVTLKGKWFEASGFKAGHLIEIDCVGNGKLVITLAKKQRF